MAEEIKKGDYSNLGLVKDENGIVSFNGKTLMDIPAAVQDAVIKHLANYGLFVEMTRELATTKDKPYTDAEKKAIFSDFWKWLETGMPKSKRTKAPSIAIATIEAKAKEMGLTPEQVATLLGKAK